MHAADELIDLVREQDELYDRLHVVQKRIEDLRAQLGARGVPPPGQDPRPTGRRSRGRGGGSRVAVTCDMVWDLLLTEPSRPWTVREIMAKFPGVSHKVVQNRVITLRKQGKIAPAGKRKQDGRGGPLSTYVVTNGSSASTHASAPN